MQLPEAHSKTKETKRKTKTPQKIKVKIFTAGTTIDRQTDRLPECYWKTATVQRHVEIDSQHSDTERHSLAGTAQHTATARPSRRD